MSGTSSTFFRDALLIAGFDLRESIRTRRALVLGLLYLLISAISSYIYVQVVRLAEEAATTMQVDAGTAAIAQDSGYQGLLLLLAQGNAAVAAHLASFPPIVLIFAWFSLTFLPWLIALTSYDLVAGDLHLRTVRFVALRTTRGAFVLGKLMSQVLLVALIAGLGMIPVLLIGAGYLKSFDILTNLLALLRTWPILALFAFAVLGPVAFASQLVRGPGAARALSILLLFMLWILSMWSLLSPPPLSALGLATPFPYKAWFFYPDLWTRSLAALACVALCAGWTWLGFQVFRRRDL